METEQEGLIPRSALDAAAKRCGNKRLDDAAVAAIQEYVARDLREAVRGALLRADAPPEGGARLGPEHLAHE
jgi:hypothetical protein